MRPSIGGSPVYYYFILSFITFPQTDTPVLMDCHVGHPQMTILQIQMILRIGWTILTPFVLPYSMISIVFFYHPMLHSFGVSFPLPTTLHQVASSFYPSLRRSLCSHILLSFTPLLLSLLPSWTLPLYLGLPRPSLEKLQFTYPRLSQDSCSTG